ncbi:MAG: ATP-binding protein [Pirellulaceae bacterium]|nr:ATP-binding protein [Pirellulaceae bacterium]
MLPTVNIDWAWTLSRKLPSDMEQGHVVIEELVQALEKSDWEGRDLFQVRMAVEEGIVNSIEHGNKRDTTKFIQVEFKVSPTFCFIRITDEGAGFCRSALRDCTDDDLLEKPRGRGVHLIENLMSEVFYSECGNQLTMFRKRNDPKLAIAKD